MRAQNEVNYCPGCQTGGRVLADRALSKLLGSDWPRTLEELEKRRPSGGGGASPAGGAALGSIRLWVSINLSLGVAIVAITLLGLPG